jgi:hypothetical protein
MLAVMPAFGGLAIYSGWLASRNPIFWDIGLLYIPFCSVLVFSGVVLVLALAFHYRWGLKTGLPVGVMLLNFPAALILVFLSTRAIPRVEVIIHNRGGEKIHDFRISMGKDSVGWGGLKNGETTTCYVYPKRETEGFDLVFHTGEGKEFREAVSCYVTNDLAEVRSEIEIGPDFAVSERNYVIR